jgi:hypothetical protein
MGWDSDTGVQSKEVELMLPLRPCIFLAEGARTNVHLDGSQETAIPILNYLYIFDLSSHPKVRWDE